MTKLYCNAPWTGLFVDTFGEIKNCCPGAEPLGNINKTPIRDILSGPVITKIRKEILENKIPNYCRFCAENEKLSGYSQRQWFINKWPDFVPEKFIPKLIDIRWSNGCQLRCVYCNPVSSSTFAAWLGSPQPMNNKTHKQDLLDYVKENENFVEHVYLLGGEPLLLKENIPLLQIIKNQPIDIITNLSIDNLQDNRSFQLLKDKNVNWQISVDNIEHKFEYVRANASWSVLDTNIKLLKSLNKPVGVQFLYNLLSAFSIRETLYYLKQFNIPCGMALLTGPEKFSIFYFPKEIKLLAIEEIDQTLVEFDQYLFKEEIQFLKNVKSSLIEQLESIDLGYIQQFKEFVSARDNESIKKFSELWPKVHQILQNWSP